MVNPNYSDSFEPKIAIFVSFEREYNPKRNSSSKIWTYFLPLFKQIQNIGLFQLLFETLHRLLQIIKKNQCFLLLKIKQCQRKSDT